MTTHEWELIWVNAVVDCGISRSTAWETFKALYADGPDLNKNPVHEALTMLKKLSQLEHAVINHPAVSAKKHKLF